MTGTEDPLAAADLRGWALRLVRVLARLDWPGLTAAGLLVGAAAAWAQAASARLAVLDAAGRTTAVSAALADSRAAVPTLFGWSALAAVLTVVGLAFGVLPGLYVAAVTTAALPGAVVVERAGLPHAAGLANRRLGGTAARFAVGLFAAALYGAIVGTVVAAAPAPVDDAVRALAALPLTLAGTAFTVVTYAGLRRSADGAGTADLAAELDPP